MHGLDTHTTSALFDPSVVQPSLVLRCLFHGPSPNPIQQVSCCLPGPGRNQHNGALVFQKKNNPDGWMEAGRQAVIDRLPSTKEAAAMPPCRPLVAGRFLQST